MSEQNPGAGDDYIGCGPYQSVEPIPNPVYNQMNSYLMGGGTISGWTSTLGNHLEPQYLGYEVVNYDGVPCCPGTAIPCGGNNWPIPGSTTFSERVNDIRWFNQNTENGINSVAPVGTPNNSEINLNSQGGWGHAAKSTKYITELIAMDWGKQDTDENGVSLAQGMDYRHRSYDGVTSAEEGGHTSYTNEMGYDSAFTFNIISQYPSQTPETSQYIDETAEFALNDYTNTFNGSAESYCTPAPPGGWIQDIKDKTRISPNFDWGCYPSEFITCSGYNQKNCSLAARWRQSWQDEFADYTGRVSNGYPTDAMAENYRPIVFTDTTMLGWDHSNSENNENINGGINTIVSLNDLMNGNNLGDAISNQIPGDHPHWVDDDERGFSMGWFFNKAKFIVEYDDETEDGPVNFGTYNIDIIRTYRLKAGFKFLPDWQDIDGWEDVETGDIAIDNGKGIHLGGNNEVDPGPVAMGGTDDYPIYAYFSNINTVPDDAIHILYPSVDNLPSNTAQEHNALLAASSLTNIALQNLKTSLDAINDGYSTVQFFNQPQPDEGGNDFANILAHENQDNYNRFSGGILDLTALHSPTHFPKIKWIHVAYHFGIRCTDFGDGGDNGSLQNQSVIFSLRDQDNNIVKNNLGQNITQEVVLSQMDFVYDVLISTAIDTQFQHMPLEILEGKTGWSSSDYTTWVDNGMPNTNTPSSTPVGGQNNSNGITQLHVGIQFPAAHEGTSYGRIEILHNYGPPAQEYFSIFNSRGFTFAPLRVIPGVTGGWTPTNL